MFRTGRGVGTRVLLELRRRGIDEALAQQTLETVTDELDPELLLREQLRRRFPDFNYQSADDKSKRRVISYFQRRGYQLGEIFLVFKEEEEQ